MKVILYMAVSLDGFVAGENDDTSWVSEAEYDAFREMAKKIGNAVYGKRTYDIGIQENIPLLEGALNVVVTHEQKENYDPYLFTNKSPKEILTEMKERKFDKVMICGGGEINGLFASENLIDEIYLDVEPIILGKGIKLFGKYDIKPELKFLESKKIGDSTIQLHYEVVKTTEIA